MHKPRNLRFALLSLAMACGTLSLTACGKATQDERIEKSMTQGVYALKADERQLAETDAKQFYNKPFPAMLEDGTQGFKNGLWMECRPSDSNANGLVTCSGYVPSQTKKIMDVLTRYCGYRPLMLGCNDQDVVK